MVNWVERPSTGDIFPHVVASAWTLSVIECRELISQLERTVGPRRTWPVQNASLWCYAFLEEDRFMFRHEEDMAVFVLTTEGRYPRSEP